MNLLSVSSLSRAGRDEPLFEHITFGVDEGEKIALIGKNGCGKSTLLSCIAGDLESETGTVVANKEAGISYLRQNPVFTAGDTIRAHIFKHDSPKLRIIKEYEAVCEELAEGKTDPKREKALHERLESLTHEMDKADLWNYENDIKSILTTLGLGDLNRPMGSLSGGMVKKVALAQVLIEDTRLLLLDEPTNHLDISTIAWLEDYLRTTDRSVLMVTHDRYFLDAVCTSIYELEYARLTRYEGNFSRYLEKKAIETEIAANTDARIESVLRTEREWLLRGPQARGTKARARIDSIHGMMDRLRLSKEQLARNKSCEFAVTGRRLGGKILEAEGICKQWPHAALPTIRDFSYTFKKGERIGVFGGNGSGKTTLLNLLTGELTADAGTLSKGENTVFAYYRQNPVFPQTDQTVLEYIKEQAENIRMPDGKTLGAGAFLEQFGFEGRIQHSRATELSGGEKKRLYLVKLLMGNPNFLVLDEPTNDFDIYTMGVLEAFLQTYTGCLLVVSHDRYFMDKIAETLFVLESDGSVSGFTGTCSEYIEAQREAESIAKKEIKASIQEKPKTSQEKAKKRTFKEQKEFEGIETEIERLETRKSELESLMSGGKSEHGKLRELAKEFEDICALIEERMNRWEYLGSIEP